jgi:hypothetical protein
VSAPVRRPMAVPWLMYRCACGHEFPAHKALTTVYAERSDYWGEPCEEYVTVKRCPNCGSPAIEPIP